MWQFLRSNFESTCDDQCVMAPPLVNSIETSSTSSGGDSAVHFLKIQSRHTPPPEGGSHHARWHHAWSPCLCRPSVYMQAHVHDLSGDDVHNSSKLHRMRCHRHARARSGQALGICYGSALKFTTPCRDHDATAKEQQAAKQSIRHLESEVVKEVEARGAAMHVRRRGRSMAVRAASRPAVDAVCLSLRGSGHGRRVGKGGSAALNDGAAGVAVGVTGAAFGAAGVAIGTAAVAIGGGHAPGAFSRHRTGAVQGARGRGAPRATCSLVNGRCRVEECSSL